MQRCLQARPKLYGAPRDIRRRYVFVRTIIQIGPTIDGYRLFIYNVSMDWVARAPSTGTMAGHRGDMLSDQTIIDAVQAALRQLYDSQTLRSSPLIGALGLTGSPNAASELRQALTKAIQGLRPDASVLPEAGAWRIYEILEYRYLQQVGQAEVARQLGLSVRHLRREEHRAAEVLAQSLRPLLFDRPSEASESRDDVIAADKDLAWISSLAPADQVDLGLVVRDVVALVSPLAKDRQIELEFDAPTISAAVHIQAVALRELILQLLTAAICHAKSAVSVCVRRQAQSVDIQIDANWPALQPDARLECQRALRLAREIAGRCGVTVKADLDVQCYRATISVPVMQGVPVLVIDDNEDTLRLLHRFAIGTPYSILAASTLAQALALAAEACPQVIVLDVLMPHADGWEMLAQLRNHPLTMHAPVLVCSILTQEELALSLGARAYLRKPVTRQAFLQTLLHLLHPAEPAPPTAL